MGCTGLDPPLKGGPGRFDVPPGRAALAAGAAGWMADALASSARRRLQKGHVTRRARWESSEIARCTQKGHGKEAQSLRQCCSSAIVVRLLSVLILCKGR